jgi:hypothetical protein
VPGDRAKALANLNRGAATFAEARARVAAAR